MHVLELFWQEQYRFLDGYQYLRAYFTHILRSEYGLLDNATSFSSVTLKVTFKTLDPIFGMHLFFLDSSVLEDWIRVGRKGSLIAFTHKTSVAPKWVEEQRRLEECGAWRRVFISQELPYLPSLKNADETSKEMATIYIYQKLWECVPLTSLVTLDFLSHE